MKISKISLIFKKAPFLSIITLSSLILFVGIYLLLTMMSINPHYFKGLVFAVPFVCFGITTFYTVKGKLKSSTSFIITVILIFVLSFTMLLAFVFISFDTGTNVTTDINKYERVLRLKGYPENPLIQYFPNKIPHEAKNIVFSYNPAFLQGEENFELKFNIDSVTINKYINQFSHKSKWVGKLSQREAENNGIFPGAFNALGYVNLPEDFTIYLIHSKPYKPEDWNHGELVLVAISNERNEIIFHVEDW